MLILLLMGTVPHDDVMCVTHDRVEVNHYYANLEAYNPNTGTGVKDGEKPEPAFTQLICWKWHPARYNGIGPGNGMYHVSAWKMMRRDESRFEGDVKVYEDVSHGKPVYYIFDGESLIRVNGTAHCITRTQYDPELMDRKMVSQEDRRGW